MFPGEYGIPKPVYFFVLPSYWLGTHSERVDPNATVEVRSATIVLPVLMGNWYLYFNSWET